MMTTILLASFPVWASVSSSKSSSIVPTQPGKPTRAFATYAFQFFGPGNSAVVRLFGRGSGRCGAGVLKQCKFLRRSGEAGESCGAEEDDGVLNAFLAEAGERFAIVGGDAKAGSVRAVDECV